MNPAMRQRVTIWCSICAGFGLYSWLVFFTTFRHPGTIGINYNTVGTDWMVYYLGARDFLGGEVSRVFDPMNFTEQVKTVFAPYLSGVLGFLPWLYPPHYLLYLLPFSGLSFHASYAVFLLVTFAGLIFAVLSYSPFSRTKRILLASLLLEPATSITVVLGQNAFMTTGLMVSGLRLVETRPVIAGILFGLMSYKPQLCLMFPLALLASRRWTVLLAAAVTICIVVGASIGLIGVGPWRQWIGLATAPPAGFVGNFMATNLYSGVSTFSDCLILGLPRTAASIIQLCQLTVAAACVVRTFARSTPLIQRLGVLLPATLLATPYLALYDLLPLAIAATWLAKQSSEEPRPDLLRFMIGIAGWIIPLLNPPLADAIGFATPVVALAVMLAFTFARSADLQEPKIEDRPERIAITQDHATRESAL
jgi:hypothetical protein